MQINYNQSWVLIVLLLKNNFQLMVTGMHYFSKKIQLDITLLNLLLATW